MAQAEARLQVYVWFSRGICTCSTGLGRGWAAAILGMALRLSDQIRFLMYTTRRVSCLNRLYQICIVALEQR